MKRSLLAVLIAVFGFVLLVAGVTVMFWPAGMVLAGVLLLAAGLFAVDVE